MPRFYSHELNHSTHQQAASEPAGLDIQASTLGELLAGLEAASGIRVIPHDPPKYFRCYPHGSSGEFHLVDIHIRRDGSEICPKQDLDFPLEDADVVEAGPLMC